MRVEGSKQCNKVPRDYLAYAYVHRLKQHCNKINDQESFQSAPSGMRKNSWYV